MIKKSVLRLLMISSVLTVMLPATAMADSGWKDNGGQWQYLAADGSVTSNRWATSNGKSFYIGSDGYMVTDTMIESGSYKYYLDTDGSMVTDAWKEVEDSNSDSGTSWFYFGENGRAYYQSGDKASKKQIGNDFYMFDSDGAMLTGFIDENGETITDTTNSFIDAVYYAGSDGKLYSNQWYEYDSLGDDSLYSTQAQRYYSEYGQMWMYFDANCKKVASNSTSSKTKDINNVSYMFDENGIMIPQLAIKNSTSVATKSSATIRYGNLDENGALTGDYWAFTVPNEGMSEEDYSTQEFSWFRTRSNGKVYKDCIKTVYGRKYAFDELGRMQTGFVEMFSDGTFAIQFDIDEYSKDDFLKSNATSDIPSIDRSGVSLYLFSSDELNDGSMQQNGDYIVELADNSTTFGFRSSGKAYGNNADGNGCITPEKHNDKYYYHGVRLDADSSLKYGIVDLNRDKEEAGLMTTQNWVVVDQNGKAQTGKKKVVKDGEGNWIVIVNSEFVGRVSDKDKPRWHTGFYGGTTVTGYWRYDSSADNKDERYVEPVSYSNSEISSDFVIFGDM